MRNSVCQYFVAGVLAAFPFHVPFPMVLSFPYVRRRVVVALYVLYVVCQSVTIRLVNIGVLHDVLVFNIEGSGVSMVSDCALIYISIQISDGS